MKKAITDERGEIISIIEGTQETIDLNTFEGCTARDVPEDLNSYWLDGWVPKGIQPQFTSWNKVTKAWVDQRSLAELQAEYWARIKNQREALMYAPILTDFGVFDADPTSQTKLSGAAQMATLIPNYSVEWTLANNTSVVLSGQDLIQIAISIGSRTATIYDRARAIRAEIEAWTQISDVSNINF